MLSKHRVLHQGDPSNSAYRTPQVLMRTKLAVILCRFIVNSISNPDAQMFCQQQMPQKKRPIYNVAMKGVTVSCTSMDKKSRVGVSWIGEWGGGTGGGGGGGHEVGLSENKTHLLESGHWSRFDDLIHIRLVWFQHIFPSPLCSVCVCVCVCVYVCVMEWAYSYAIVSTPVFSRWGALNNLLLLSLDFLAARVFTSQSWCLRLLCSGHACSRNLWGSSWHPEWAAVYGSLRAENPPEFPFVLLKEGICKCRST